MHTDICPRCVIHLGAVCGRAAHELTLCVVHAAHELTLCLGSDRVPGPHSASALLQGLGIEAGLGGREVALGRSSSWEEQRRQEVSECRQQAGIDC